MRSVWRALRAIPVNVETPNEHGRPPEDPAMSFYQMFVGAVVASWLVACGGSSPEPKTPEAEPPAAETPAAETTAEKEIEESEPIGGDDADLDAEIEAKDAEEEVEH